jgi:hypothetical protein
VEGQVLETLTRNPWFGVLRAGDAARRDHRAVLRSFPEPGGRRGGARGDEFLLSSTSTGSSSTSTSGPSLRVAWSGEASETAAAVSWKRRPAPAQALEHLMGCHPRMAAATSASAVPCGADLCASPTPREVISTRWFGKAEALAMIRAQRHRRRALLTPLLYVFLRRAAWLRNSRLRSPIGWTRSCSRERR